ncbi:phage shock protein operon transcriptional activator [Marinomonas agarivorans]|nr:phage shock protein operon transcriptional activator [Marinomonas agarivorans]
MAASNQRVIGTSSQLAKVLDHTSALASINRPVLIMGERGTGKELIAERLHYLSPRWDQPFIAINCAAINEELMESELFGHEPGAFTGATKIHQGRFERADGGSLFLDELGTMSLRLQEKLLRVLEYGEFQRLGGQKTHKVDVRIIAATNADLKSMAAKHTFRADLLDRLAFDVINLPPLRERQHDIPELAEHFAIRMAIELDQPEFAGFSSQAIEQLMSYDWPGNIRELKNVVERSVFRCVSQSDNEQGLILNEVIIDPFSTTSPPCEPTKSAQHGSITVEETPEDTHKNAIDSPNLPKLPFKQALLKFERKLLFDALAANHNHQKRTAHTLGLSYDQLRGLIKKHVK